VRVWGLIQGTQIRQTIKRKIVGVAVACRGKIRKILAKLDPNFLPAELFKSGHILTASDYPINCVFHRPAPAPKWYLTLRTIFLKRMSS
jgi:hypothetical protein